ncbi:MAG TPA: hypothetical protein PKE45_25860 [Caldilineaceae bacterium]|nr:hypothetical protein [Caldilineaceae bacterium]
MIETAVQQLEACIEQLKQGRLTEAALQEVVGILKQNGGQHQDLLYLQSSESSVASPVIGMSLVQNGKVVEQLADSPWPYANVLEALRDGWRVIQFPNLALMLDENRPAGLGREFILEKWS